MKVRVREYNNKFHLEYSVSQTPYGADIWLLHSHRTFTDQVKAIVAATELHDMLSKMPNFAGTVWSKE